MKILDSNPDRQMFRLFVMVLLLTGNINAAKGKSGGNQRKSNEECACPYTDNDCFDETGCFRYPDDFSLMKCSVSAEHVFSETRVCEDVLRFHNFLFSLHQKIRMFVII